ncbi:hypothetical protein AGR6A_Lc90561 [Agrobacterium sp. NCPPB 925]|nr:hypothetical protein AGR6A_Lc90561 [Agrobacterium sp. NCPPB 925]
MVTPNRLLPRTSRHWSKRCSGRKSSVAKRMMVFVALSSPDDPGGLFFRCAKSKMDERIGSPLSVEVGASLRLETQPAIKAQRFAVLLVNIGGQRGVKRQRALHQGHADAFAVMVRIDEKRLHVPFMQKHEAEGMIRIIDGERQRHLWQERFDFLADRSAIRWKKETMGRIDSPAPNVEDAGRVATGGGTKFHHAQLLAIAIFSRHGPARSFREHVRTQ